MKKVCERFSCSFLCIIFVLNSLFCTVFLSSSTVYAATALLENDLFWDVLQSAYDFQQTAGYMDDFIIAPSDEFNAALKNLVDMNFPFGATPHLQNSYGSIPITLTSTPVAYLPFYYQSTQSSDNIRLGATALCATSDKCGRSNISSSGVSSSVLTGSVPSYSAYAIICDISVISLAAFNTSNDALFGTHFQKILCQTSSFSRSSFGVFEFPCDDSSVFVPPVSSLPSGSDVYIPRGALKMSELSYKVGDDFYDIEGNPISDPKDPNGGNGSMNGNITVGGKIDVNVSVPDININVNGGTGDVSSYEIPDTGFLNDYLDVALEESSAIRRFIADFFGTLPGQITTLICIALVFAILMRIIGR